MPKVSVRVRKGDKGVNDAAAERAWSTRPENEWPIARTDYQRWYLTPKYTLGTDPPSTSAVLNYKALGSLKDPQLFQFRSAPSKQETEITGHITAHLNLSLTRQLNDLDAWERPELDIFVTLRHIGVDRQEITYTGAAGDPVALANGWLRLSLRKVDEDHPKHRPCLPRRNYLSTDVLSVEPGEVYEVDVEVWPTNVVVEEGCSLLFEISSGDTRNSGLFTHDNPVDRPASRLAGLNYVHFGDGILNYVVLPIMPPANESNQVVEPY
ncbi:hypothetical protein LTR84_006787 [Exophiala bonariae]|uniref:Xaa-Pro dipeptidyl-peptidase C-terminal domain-containing protein n=1 Tax=Exophiala bonariae TaxID=1690606 RepID=A0AAV9N387_9EURO|nr:hypothetical protein LTR84_006787 [Exophiala bonariae]